MPGVALHQCDRPPRVRWLTVWAGIGMLVFTFVSSIAQDSPSKPRRSADSRPSRDLLKNPEEEATARTKPRSKLASETLELPDEEDLSGDDFFNEPIVGVQIEGRETILEHAITRQLKVKAGRVVTPQEVQDDVAALMRTHWFSSVRPIYRRSDAGLVLVYEVRERPIIR